MRQKLLQLLRAYSPSAQVKWLLQACKLLYTALKSQAGENAGADEFLPLLSLVLAQCDLPDLLLEAEYMSELLEPTLLTGEGGYYLTSLSASLALLSGLSQARALPLSPAQELQRSLALWEQRRLPATHSFQVKSRSPHLSPIDHAQRDSDVTQHSFTSLASPYNCDKGPSEYQISPSGGCVPWDRHWTMSFRAASLNQHRNSTDTRETANSWPLVPAKVLPSLSLSFCLSSQLDLGQGAPSLTFNLLSLAYESRVCSQIPDSSQLYHFLSVPWFSHL